MQPLRYRRFLLLKIYKCLKIDALLKLLEAHLLLDNYQWIAADRISSRKLRQKNRAHILSKGYAPYLIVNVWLGASSAIGVYRCVFDRLYLKPTEACHTKARSRKKTGRTGKTSIRGPNAR